MSAGKVWFVGAGPGAADLLTLRGARVIGEADVVVWAASLVHEDVLAHARPGAEVVDSAALPLEGVRGLYERAVAEGLVVARIHSGAVEAAPDPTIRPHWQVHFAVAEVEPCVHAARAHGGTVVRVGTSPTEVPPTEAVLRDPDGARFTVTSRRDR